MQTGAVVRRGECRRNSRQDRRVVRQLSLEIVAGRVALVQIDMSLSGEIGRTRRTAPACLTFIDPHPQHRCLPAESHAGLLMAGN